MCQDNEAITKGRQQLMVKKIMRNPMFLGQKSENATEADKQVTTDLPEALRANMDRCNGIVIEAGITKVRR